jgi:hypothetical protein
MVSEHTSSHSCGGKNDRKTVAADDSAAFANCEGLQKQSNLKEEKNE